MIVYLVNRNSKFKGPFDIIGSNRQHIIKVGDICLRDTNDGVAFLFVTNSNNSWNACKQVGVGANSELSGLGNTLLFSFDGLHKRNGNTLLINQLSGCYKEKVIVDFFRNAINILEYKTDFWDASLFVKFLASSQELISSKDLIEPSNIPPQKPSSTNSPSLFAQYLSDDLQNYLIKYTNEGKELKEAYLLLRDKDPSSFRSAFLKFVVENPDRTIYDKPSFSDNQEPFGLESDNDNEKSIQEVVHEVEDSNPYIYDEESANEFNELLNRYRHGDRKALNMLIERNMRLVDYIARSYKDRGAQHEDLVQEGIIGLMTALERFNISKKVPFAFYAKWWINQSILASLITMQTMIKIPSKQRTLYKKIKKKIEAYEQEYGHTPSAYEIELDEEIDPQNLEYLLSLPDNILELTTGKTDLDTIQSSDFSVDDELIKESKVYFVNNIISKLKKRESQIIRAAFGIGGEEKDLSEIGEYFGLSRERVRQIKAKAVSHLRDLIKFKKVIKDNSEDSYSLSEFKEIDAVKRKEQAKKHVEAVQRNKEDRTIAKKQVEILLSKSTNKTEDSSPSTPKDDIIGNTILYDSKKCIVIDTKIRGNAKRLVVKYENGTIDDVIYDKDKIIFAKKNEPSTPVIEHPPKEKPRLKDEMYPKINIKKTESPRIGEIDVNLLKTIFDKKVTSYKYFWFMAIISIAEEKGMSKILYKDILIRMASIAWPIVIGKEIKLGNHDMIPKCLKKISDRSPLNKYTSSIEVVFYLEKEYYKMEYNILLSPLLKNVPFRFLSPWIKYTSDKEVTEMSKKIFAKCPYALYVDSVVLNPAWFDYIHNHYQEICNYVINSFKIYAMQYNSEEDINILTCDDWELLINH